MALKEGYEIEIRMVSARAIGAASNAEVAAELRDQLGVLHREREIALEPPEVAVGVVARAVEPVDPGRTGSAALFSPMPHGARSRKGDPNRSAFRRRWSLE